VDATAAVQACLDEIIRRGAYRTPQERRNFAAVKAILALDPKTQVQVIREFLGRLSVTHISSRRRLITRFGDVPGPYVTSILGRLLQRKLPFGLSDLLLLLEKSQVDYRLSAPNPAGSGHAQICRGLCGSQWDAGGIENSVGGFSKTTCRRP
jgi:hypothetical protein